jgi:2-keto-4-pentenoate hydratase/2-oxohepta-3-ene-1,7-dioic acid hydratase in catechol pathway
MKLIFIAPATTREAAPVFYLKPDTALLRNHQPFFCPEFTHDLRANVSLVLRIGRLGRSIGAAFAERYIEAVGVGMDLWAHDVLQQCICEGAPHDKARAFDYTAPVSAAFLPVRSMREIDGATLQLSYNGTPLESGGMPYFLHRPAEIIAFVSQFLTLRMGDYLFIGTNLVTGTLCIGDELRAFLNGKEMLRVKIK